ncbi:hypothetical protein PLESTF_000864800 [Pleodorina starrii]|nr:hypothetical protein PLESTF_000864800 [Pleodorina starrii]
MPQLVGPFPTACAHKSTTLLCHRIHFGWAQAAAAVSHHFRQGGVEARPVTTSRAAAADGCKCACAGHSPGIADEPAGSRAFSSADASPSTRSGLNSFSGGGTKTGRSVISGSSGSGLRAMRSVAARAGGGSQSGGESGDGFWTLQGYVLYESEVKKSKFVVHAWPVSSSSEALSLIRSASDPSASHNCFAYRIGPEFRSSDDGEPGGTAGRPIQAALDGEGLDRVAVLVTRYFGGIKLGAGGLVRAYGGAAKECLRLAPRVFAKAQSEVVVEVTYDELGTAYSCLDMYGCTRLAEEYGSSGTVTIRAMVDADKLESLRAAVADGTGGRRRVELATTAAEAAATAH